MDTRKNPTENAETQKAASPPETEKEQVIKAHDEAEADIEDDPDMALPTPNDDLDEGELANLGGDKNDLV